MRLLCHIGARDDLRDHAHQFLLSRFVLTSIYAGGAAFGAPRCSDLLAMIGFVDVGFAFRNP
jgi:hypothetical protein